MLKQYMQCTYVYNATPRRVPAIIHAVEKQWVLHILGVSL